MIYAALGETDEAFRWLDAMYSARHMYTPWVRVLPELSPCARIRASTEYPDVSNFRHKP